MAMTSTIDQLRDHPNAGEILGVLGQLPHVRDADLPRLARCWANDGFVAQARATALSPDSPLVCDALVALDLVRALFEDDLRDGAPYVVVDPQVTVVALRAVRDAVAAAYARPVLTRAEHAALMRPWRAVHPEGTGGQPDLGPQTDQVRALLATLPLLAARCHEPVGMVLWDALVDRSFVGESERAEAVATAFDTAVLSNRRRVWAQVRRDGAEGLDRPCRVCRTWRSGDRDAQRVTGLCLDALGALVVSDALPAMTMQLLLAPVSALVPPQRTPSL